MNKSKVQPFSGSKSSDAFQPLRGYCLVEKRQNRIAKCPEWLRTRAFASLVGFCIYTHYGRVSAIPTWRVYRLSDTAIPMPRVSVVFGTAVPTSLHILGNCFLIRMDVGGDIHKFIQNHLFHASVMFLKGSYIQSKSILAYNEEVSL